MKLAIPLTGLLACFLPSVVDAEFRVTCSPFKRERIDALVSPGREASHMHTFWGSRAIGADPPTVDALRSSCHTCNNAYDHSAYWVPTLYYVSKNATIPVKVAIFHVYYTGQSNGRTPFPNDYRIVSGNASLTENDAKAQGGIGMSWYFESSDEEKEAWELPKQKGGGWLRGNVPFPTEVVNDPALGRYRACISKTEAGCFSVNRMFFAVWYDVRDDYFDFKDGAYLTLASGGGQTYHGDFIYGWDEDAASIVVQDPTGAFPPKNQSDECVALNAEDPMLTNSDRDALRQAKDGINTVELGVYGRYLTITDGKSVNSTWDGLWLEDSSQVNVELAPSTEASSLEPSITTIRSQPAGNKMLPMITSSSFGMRPASSIALSNDNGTKIPGTTLSSAEPTPASTTLTTFQKQPDPISTNPFRLSYSTLSRVHRPLRGSKPTLIAGCIRN